MQLASKRWRILIVSGLVVTSAWAGAVTASDGGSDGLSPPTHGWTGEATHLGGTAGYDSGTWIHQDFVYDDYGADTGGGSHRASLSPTAGDFRYPAGPAYEANSADLLEVRVRPNGSLLDVRVELNTLVDRNTTVLGVALDAGAGQLRDWPNQAGVRSVWDHFVTVAEGDVWLNRADQPAQHTGFAHTDLAENTIAFRIPDLGDRAAVSLNVGAGLWDAANGTWLPGSPAPQATGGFFSGLTPTPVRVFDLAFNTREIEPLGANWQEEAQSDALLATDVTAFTQRVDLDRARSGTTDAPIVEPGFYNRIFTSRQDLGEGTLRGQGGQEAPFPQYLGEDQPYALWLPEDYDPSEETPLVLVLHSLELNHNQYAGQEAYTTFYEQIGDGLGAIVATPLARGPDGWYENEALVDTLEVLEDVREHYNVDDDRISVTGYSMGGFGTYRLPTLFADRFAAGVSWSGVPTSQHLLDNVHEVPIQIIHGTLDELVPIQGVRDQADRLAELGYEYRFHEHPAIDHFALAFLDEWSRSVQWLDGRKLDADPPATVTFRIQPSTQIADRTDARTPAEEDALRDHVEALGYDLSSSFWVEEVQVRGNASTLATVEATSEAIAERVPVVTPYESLQPGPATPYIEEGNLRTLSAADTTNTLNVTLERVSNVTFQLARAGLDTSSELLVPVDTGGLAGLLLAGSFPDGVTVEDADTGDPVPFTRTPEGLEVEVDAPGRTLRIVP